MDDAFTKKEMNQSQPAEYETESDIMNDDVTADRDTNGISASMVRFGDSDGIPYAEELDEVSVEFHEEADEQ